MNNTKKLTLLSVLTGQAIILHYIESFIPAILPGVKLGLANIITLLTIMMLGFKEAIFVVVIRSVLAPLLAGSPTAILYSLAGGLLSCFVMSFLYFHFGKYFSIIGISTAGAIFHNVAQLIVASWVFGNIGIFFTYTPILIAFAVITGFFTGLVAGYVAHFLKLNTNI